MEAETRKELLNVWSIKAGETYGHNSPAILIANNSKVDLEVTIMKVLPPAPPPKCYEWLAEGDNEGAYLHCDLLLGHEGPHADDVAGTTVFWNDKAEDVGEDD